MNGQKNGAGLDKPKRYKIIKASHLLRAKVGTGTIDEKLISKCQHVMDQTDFDFAPLAGTYLADLLRALEGARDGGLSKDDALHKMTEAVMGLKANGSLFRYGLVGNLAKIMLDFLEGIDFLDDAALEIVSAYHKSQSAIISRKMQGDGGAAGQALLSELKSVCARYFKARSGS